MARYISRNASKWMAAAGVGVFGMGNMLNYTANAKGNPAGNWNSSEVGGWLSSVGLSMYASNFRANNVDGDILLNDLTEDIAISELGVKKLHAKKLMREVQGLNAGPMPVVKSKHSLVAQYLTPDVWKACGGKKTATTGFTVEKAIACATEFDNQHCGIYAGDFDSYRDFAPLFDPIIEDYHGIDSSARHQSDMNPDNLKGNVDAEAPVLSCRIRVGRNLEGFGLSPGITKDQRLEVERLMTIAFEGLEGDLAGTYYPLTGMDEATRLQLIDDHFLFVSGDPNLKVSGMERDWPEARGIFHNKDKTFLVWVNEEDQLRIISMQKGGDAVEVFSRLARGIRAIEESVMKVTGNDVVYQYDDKYGYIHSCPTNLGTGMRASVHITLPGWAKDKKALKKRCAELKLQLRGARGESGGDTGALCDISNKHRLGYSEVELVQTMIDGVNALVKEDLQRQQS